MYLKKFLDVVKYYFMRSNLIRFENGSDIRICILYLTKPLANRNISLSQFHQNVSEARSMFNIIKSKGYDVDVYDFNKRIKSGKCYDIIFGLEPNFSKLLKNNKNCLPVYYATGAYYKHQNDMIISRTNDFNSRYSTAIPYRRLVEPHNSVRDAKYVLQIGTQSTIETYPVEFREKIRLIDQSSFPFNNIDIEKKLEKSSKKDFLWFGSTGTILKGLDILIEYFIEHPEFNLHVVGPVESDVLDAIKSKYKIQENILFYGFMNVSSIEFREILDVVSYIIFPSASEGGCPGSVLNAMKLGVIPITSKWASHDKITSLGYELKEISMVAIGQSVEWSQNLTDEERRELAFNSHQYVENKYSLERFEEQFNDFIDSLVKEVRNK